MFDVCFSFFFFFYLFAINISFFFMCVFLFIYFLGLNVMTVLECHQELADGTKIYHINGVILKCLM